MKGTKNFGGEATWKTPLRLLEDNIKMDLRETG
jgi:hypothetical protein